MQRERHIYTNRPPQENQMFKSWQEYDFKHLTVYTNPVAKGRPRFTKNGHAYTPKETAEYENLIRQCWITAHGKSIYPRYIDMALDFYMPIPKSMSKADKEKALLGELRPDKKPDIDNLIKAVQDALNETAYWDDKQIVRLRADKWYATEGRVEITLREMKTTWQDEKEKKKRTKTT